MVRAALVVCLLAACGRIGFDGLDVEELPEHSGTRLRIVWGELDGVRHILGLHDTLRNERCFYSDREGICVPAVRGVSLAFSDSACTQTVALLPQSSCPSTSPYVIPQRTTSCEPILRYRLGAPSPATMYYVQNAQGTCTGPFTPSNEDIYTLGPLLDPAELAPIMQEAVASNGRLRTTRVFSDDGLQLNGHLYDTGIAAHCTIVPGLSGLTSSCIPHLDGTSINYYGDASCTRPKVESFTTCVPPLASKVDACANVEYHRVLGPIAGDPIYSSSPCQPAASNPASFYFDVDPVPLDIATFTVSPHTTTSRLTRYLHRSNHGGFLGTFFMHDNLLDVSCTIRERSDGTVECMPGYSGYGTMYTDAACTQPIDIATVPYATCANGPRTRFASAQDGCGSVTRLFEMGDVYTGALYTLVTTTLCQPLTNLPNTEHRRVGPERSLSEVARGSLVIE